MLFLRLVERGQPMTERKSATRKEVMARIEELGAMIYSHDSKEIVVDAPSGMKFKACNLHCFVQSDWDGQVKWPQIWAACIDDMSEGVVACEDTECDICAEVPEEERL
jgi:hypothetical protein